MEDAVIGTYFLEKLAVREIKPGDIVIFKDAELAVKSITKSADHLIHRSGKTAVAMTIAFENGPTIDVHPAETATIRRRH